MEVDYICDESLDSRFRGNDGRYGFLLPTLIEKLQLIRLINQANLTIDRDERDRIYRQIIPIFVEDLPVTFLLPKVQTIVVHRRIKGLKSPYKSDPFFNMVHLWIEEKK